MFRYQQNFATMETEAPAAAADSGVPEFEVKKTSVSEEVADPAPAEAVEATNGTNGGGHDDHDGSDAVTTISNEPGNARLLRLTVSFFVSMCCIYRKPKWFPSTKNERLFSYIF